MAVTGIISIIIIAIGLCSLDSIFFIIVNCEIENPRYIIWISNKQGKMLIMVSLGKEFFVLLLFLQISGKFEIIFK